jgi:hypothetical protein
MPKRVPRTRYFNIAVPCRHRKTKPRIDGLLKDWQKKFILPDMVAVDGRNAFAEFYLAWNDAGIYLAMEVKGKANPITVEENQFWTADCLEVWFDMRDARAMHHASLYCHQFVFLPPTGAKGEPLARQVDITRGSGKGQMDEPDGVTVASKKTESGYTLEAAISADALHGFDPVEHPRLGFTYHINDTHLGAQYWSIDKRFRFMDNPSMWGTVILTD